MEYEDEHRRRRLTGDVFQDGNIVVTVRPPDRRGDVAISLERFSGPPGEERRRIQAVVVDVRRLDDVVERAVNIADDRRRERQTPSERTHVVARLEHADLEASVLEKVRPGNEVRSYLHLATNAVTGEFTSELMQLARITKAAAAMARSFGQAEEMRLPDGTTSLLARAKEEEGFVHVVRYLDRNREGDHVVRIERSFPATERAKARLFADRDAYCELMPDAADRRMESGSVVSLRADRFEALEPDLPKLHREARHRSQREEDDGTCHYVGVWADAVMEPRVGLSVKRDEGRDYRREARDYRVSTARAPDTELTGSYPAYVLVGKEDSRILRVFSSREGAVSSLRELDGPPLRRERWDELRQIEQRRAERQDAQQLDLSKESYRFRPGR